MNTYHCKPLFLCNGLSRVKQVMFAQLRMGFSNLNAHLFNHGCTDNQSCSCGHNVEDCHHFFMDCHLYDELRTDTFQRIRLILPESIRTITTDLLLVGNTSLNFNQSTILQTLVINFVYNTGRFQ